MRLPIEFDGARVAPPAEAAPTTADPALFGIIYSMISEQDVRTAWDSQRIELARMSP